MDPRQHSNILHRQDNPQTWAGRIPRDGRRGHGGESLEHFGALQGFELHRAPGRVGGDEGGRAVAVGEADDAAARLRVDDGCAVDREVRVS